MVTFTCWGCFQTPVILWDRLGCPLFHGLLCLSTLAESNAATKQRAVLLGTDSHHSHCDCFQPFMESHTEYIFTNSTTILSQFHIKEAHTWQHCCLHGENVVSIFAEICGAVQYTCVVRWSTNTNSWWEDSFEHCARCTCGGSAGSIQRRLVGETMDGRGK